MQKIKTVLFRIYNCSVYQTFISTKYNFVSRSFTIKIYWLYIPVVKCESTQQKIGKQERITKLKSLVFTYIKQLWVNSISISTLI